MYTVTDTRRSGGLSIDGKEPHALSELREVCTVAPPLSPREIGHNGPIPVRMRRDFEDTIGGNIESLEFDSWDRLDYTDFRVKLNRLIRKFLEFCSNRSFENLIVG